jgi:hypothetical protein
VTTGMRNEGAAASARHNTRPRPGSLVPADGDALAGSDGGEIIQRGGLCAPEGGWGGQGLPPMRSVSDCVDSPYLAQK